jgi:hypothetical protein
MRQLIRRLRRLKNLKDCTDGDLAVIAYTALNLSQLTSSLHEMGFTDAEIDPIEGGFELRIADTSIARGIAEHPIDASEELMDRAAQLFFTDVIRA